MERVMRGTEGMSGGGKGKGLSVGGNKGQGMGGLRVSLLSDSRGIPSIRRTWTQNSRLRYALRYHKQDQLIIELIVIIESVRFCYSRTRDHPPLYSTPPPKITASLQGH